MSGYRQICLPRGGLPAQEYQEIHEFAQVQPFHVAAFVHDLQDELSPPSVKQHLAAIRMLFDWLVTGHVIEANPAHSVRGPAAHGQERQDAGPNA